YLFFFFFKRRSRQRTSAFVGGAGIFEKEKAACAPRGAFYTRRGTGMRTRLARRLNIHIGWITNDEDAELVARVQKGLTTPGFEPGPLSRRESAVGWFAGRVRADLGGAEH
ncbi:SRPBCC family protein, partial [Streptomyces lunaelactis]|uniref:SRPBCC family protein n=1 Tax=Streptomyces lunaelactis TaxID=1535768 RepID=UPI00267573AC